MTSATMVPSAIALGGSESAATSSPDRDVSKGLLLKHHESPSSRTTDDTLSTTNCDDSLTASTSAAEVRLYADPPVTAVSVDRRSVRQRMRDQEAKINALLHKPATATPAAASDGVLMKLVQTLEADLKKAQDQTKELQDELDSLKAAKEDAKDSSSEVAKAVDVPDAQRIADLEVQLRRKTNEACLLRDRWENTLRRMVQYQVDLEQHDLHFTDYAEQHFRLADDALKELKELTHKDQPPATRQMGKKAKHMMSTLLKDLEVLGERYADARVHQEEQLENLRVAQVEWQRRAEYLESICAKHDIDLQEEEDAPQSTSTNPAPMTKLLQKLGLESTEEEQSQQELEAQVKVAEEQTKQAQLERDVLEKEVARLNQTVSKLQNATKIQQEGLQKAQQAAAARAAAVPKKKRKGLFMKTKKTPPPPPPLPIVDVAAVLVPMDGESQRFDMFHERLQSQNSALHSLQQDYRRVARQKAQLQHTVKELRLEQEQDKATSENKALKEMQLQMDELEAKRVQEQEQAQSAIDELRARLAALEAKEAS